MTISSGSIAFGLQQRDQRQLRTARIAAGIGDQLRRFDLRPIDFGEPVDRLLLQLERRVRMPIPARIRRRIGKSEIGRQIDHLESRHPPQQIRDDLLRRAVRQRAEDEIEAERRPVDVIERRQHWQRVRRELRKHVGHRLAGAAIRGEQHNVGARMGDEEPHQFRTGIAGGADDADLRRFFLRRHDSTLWLGNTKPASAGKFLESVPRSRRHRRLRANACPCRAATASARGGNGHGPDNVGRPLHGPPYRGRTVERQCARTGPARWIA